MRTSTLTGLRPPTASTAPFLQRTKQFHLCGRRQFADLVEKQRAAGGFDEFAHVAFGGAGKGAFSWPNRIDSTRLSGIAPQLTATNGFDCVRRCHGWRARTVPCRRRILLRPVRESSRAAAFCAVRSTPAIASLRVMISAKVNLPSRLCLMRCSSPFSALR